MYSPVCKNYGDTFRFCPVSPQNLSNGSLDFISTYSYSTRPTRRHADCCWYSPHSIKHRCITWLTFSTKLTSFSKKTKWSLLFSNVAPHYFITFLKQNNRNCPYARHMSSSCLKHRNFQMVAEGKEQNINIVQEKSIIDHRSLGLRRNWLHFNMRPVTKLFNRTSVEFWTLPSANGEIKHNIRRRIRNITFLLPTSVNMSLPTMIIKTVPSYFSCTGIHIFTTPFISIP